MSLARLQPINFSIIWTTQQFFHPGPRPLYVPAEAKGVYPGGNTITREHKTDLNLITCLAYFVIFP